MLGKLLKKDFISTCRLFLPLLCGYTIAAVVGKLLFEILLSQSRLPYDGFYNGIAIFSLFYMGICIIYLIACYLMTSVFVVYDFYKTMVSDHGYLTHTLPVKTSTLIWSKTLMSAFWHILVNLIISLSFLLLFTGHLKEVPVMDIFRSFLHTMDSSFGSYSFYTAINAVIQLFNSPLMFFACIALGQLWKNHRILGAILSYIGIYVFGQILNVIMLVATGNSSILMGSMDFFFNGYMTYATLYGIITTVIFFLITNYILSNHLNLE
ncbi:MAG: hypothetical protein HFG70_05440 [Hungatella sp.]|nr:hypothetical protein [Hungatella sp.]